MSEVIVAFWTGTGNTAEMAEYVAEGIKVEAILDEKLYSKAEKYIVD